MAQRKSSVAAAVAGPAAAAAAVAGVASSLGHDFATSLRKTGRQYGGPLGHGVIVANGPILRALPRAVKRIRAAMRIGRK